MYSETHPYSHLGNTVTSLLQPLFLAAWQNLPYIFLLKKTLVKTATPLIRPNFFSPLVTALTGFSATNQERPYKQLLHHLLFRDHPLLWGELRKVHKIISFNDLY